VLNVDVPFSGDSGKGNSEVCSTLSQGVKCPLSAAPVQTRKYDIPYGDVQLLVFFESLFDRKLYRSFIVLVLLIVSLMLVMCHSILFSTDTGGLQLIWIRQLLKVSDEISYCRAHWLGVLVVVVYLGMMASGFNLRQKRPRLALGVLIVDDDRQRGQLLSHPVSSVRLHPLCGEDGLITRFTIRRVRLSILEQLH